MNIPIDTLVSTLAGLFLLLGAGFVGVRLHLVPAEASSAFTALLMRITVPATIFTSMLRPFDPNFLVDSLIIFLLGMGFFLLFALICHPASHLFRVEHSGRGMWMMCCTFCNNGSMGFPVILALFGEEGLALAAMLGTSFNLLAYTLGARQVLMDMPSASGEAISWKKILFTEVNAATAIGLVFFCLQLSVPSAILTPLQHLSNITTPLSMFLIGMALAKGSLRAAFREKDVFSASFMRLLVLPLVTWAILKVLPFVSPLVFNVVLLTMAMPCPGTSTMLAEQYGINVDLSSHIVFFSSLLCLLTIPIITLLP